MVQTIHDTEGLPLVKDVLARGALLLDLDGTLLDFAPRPDAVHLPHSLRSDLTFLYGALGGALAIVTGRRLDDVDGLLAPLRLPVAAEHGGELRRTPDGQVTRQHAAKLPPGWDLAAREFAAADPRLVHEAKSAGFVLHYRLAPDRGDTALAFLRKLIAETDGFEILSAAQAWELRPCGVDKGNAVRALMKEPSFAGRIPIFIGDDVTDEDAIAAAQAMGGNGLRVADAFGSPAAVRAWLSSFKGATHAPTP